MDAKGNPKYKDALFKAIFGSEKRKQFTLDLYNAVNNSDYKNVDDITLITLEDILLISMKNDVGFLFNSSINLYEQQSTWNPNMPFRMFEYTSKMLTKFVDDNYEDSARYGSVPLRLPTPKCVVFYNGGKNIPSTQTLRQSEMFETKGQADIECTVTMYNISKGKSKELLESCRPLKEYAMIVNTVSLYKNVYGKGEDATSKAINEAIKKIPSDYLLYPFIQEEKKKVTNMLKTEYNEKEMAKEFEKIGYSNALRTALRQFVELRKQSSLSDEEIYNEIVKMKCYSDLSFNEFKNILNSWF